MKREWWWGSDDKPYKMLKVYACRRRSINGGTRFQDAGLNVRLPWLGYVELRASRTK